VSLLGRPRRKLGWGDLSAHIASVGPADLTASTDEPCWVRWHEGPAIATVVALVGDTPGWEWRAVSPAIEPSEPPPGDGGVIWVRRSLSRQALAVALVRFYGAMGRHFTTDDERGRQRFAEICDHDDPALSGYPIVDHVAAALLRSPQTDPAMSHIDELSAALKSIGYERLWSEAFKAIV
jgi:hypothetical protein